MKLCCVPGCYDHTSKRYIIPHDANVQEIWLRRINNHKLMCEEINLDSFRVCGNHFADMCFQGLDTLKRYALPTLNLPGFVSPSTEATCFCYPNPDGFIERGIPEIRGFPSRSFSDDHKLELKVNQPYKTYQRKSFSRKKKNTSVDVVSPYVVTPITDHSYSQLDELNNTLQVQKLGNLPMNEAAVEKLINLPTNEAGVEELINLPTNGAAVGIQRKSKLKVLPCLQEIKLLNSETKQTEEMCRICFQGVNETECIIFNNDDAECKTNETKQIILSHFPTLDFQMVIRSVICNNCIKILEDYEKLKETFKATEKKFILMLSETRTPRDQEKDRILTVVEDTVDIEIDEKVEARLQNQSTILSNSTGSLKYHVRRDKTVLCETCGLKCRDGRELTRHRFKHMKQKLREERLKEKRALEATPKICEKCGVVVKNANDLRRHLETHSPLPCPRCNKIFYRKNNLYTHLRYTHDRKFTVHQCDICGKQFDKHNLIDHMKRHGPKSQFCDICNKAFFTVCALRKHKTSHTNNMFACSLCDKVLKYKESLEKHVQLIHYKDANIVCKICCKPFWKQYDLKKHLIRCHGKENN